MRAGQPDSHRSAEPRVNYSFIHDIWGKNAARDYWLLIQAAMTRAALFLF